MMLVHRPSQKFCRRLGASPRAIARIALFFGMGAFSTLGGCKSQDNRTSADAPPIDSRGSLLHHLTVIPGAEQLALGFVVDRAHLGTDRSDVRSVALAHMDGVSEAIALMHERMKDMEKAIPTVVAGDADCRSWKADDTHHDWELISCARDPGERRYEIRLEARPIGAGGDQVSIIIAGEAKLDLIDAHPWVRPDRKLRQRLQRTGRIGYDFDRLRAIVGSGPVGAITIGYRVDDAARALNVELTAFAPTPEVMPLSGNQTFEDAVGSGGRTELIVASDFVQDDGNGGLMRGPDGKLERSGLSLAWDLKGSMLASVESCTPESDGELPRCSHLNQCWGASGLASYESYSKSGDGLEWLDAECPAAPLPIQVPPDPRDDARTADGDLPSARAPIPGFTEMISQR